MSSNNQLISIALAANVLAGAPEAVSGKPIDADSAQRRLQVSLGPMGASPYRAGRTIQSIAGGRMSESAMLHRFQVDLVDSLGAPIADAPAWQVAVLAGAAEDSSDLRTLVQLTARSRDLRLPKPLGYRIEHADSFLVVATINDLSSEHEQLYVRVTIEYEPMNGAISRLAVVPLQAASSDVVTDGNTYRRSWEWQADVSGRMLAMSGALLEDARELVLEDANTGAVLWRRANRTAGPAFHQATQTERLGVAVGNTGRYRLTAIYSATTTPRTNDGASVFALVLPK